MKQIAMNTRIKDLSGKVFGKLTVVSLAGTRKGRSHWNCKCECGGFTQVASNNLRLSKQNRCGRCTILPLGEALARIIFRDYKYRAKYDDIEFSLSPQDVKSIISRNCFYCGSKPVSTKTRNGRAYAYNGIDRVDSSKGYVLGNVRSCCGICNTMKLDYTEQEFKNQINMIHSHWAGK